MKKLQILGIIFLLVAAADVSANSSTEQSDRAINNYENLGLQNAKPIQLTEDEVAEMQQQAVDGFQKQVEMSDPEVKAAILKIQETLQRAKAKDSAQSDSAD